MDTIANLITSIRNAEMAGHKSLTVPNSKIALNLLEILKEQRYLKGYTVKEDIQFQPIEITLQANLDEAHHYRRISKPGRRMYVNHKTIPSVRRGNGLVVISTSLGLLTGSDAKKKGVGGEIICEVY